MKKISQNLNLFIIHNKLGDKLTEIVQFEMLVKYDNQSFPWVMVKPFIHVAIIQEIFY